MREVELEKVRISSEVITDYSSREQDVFNTEYRQATRAVRNILEANKRVREEAKQAVGDKGGCRRKSYREHQSNEHLHTVIPFIGDRGTGKSSVMRTVFKWLENSVSVFKGDEMDGVLSENRFFCLDMIDAGVLRNKEDILEIILARMLRYVKQYTDEDYLQNDDLRALYQKIDKLYRNLVRLNQQEPFHRIEGASALNDLEKLSSSHSTGREFKELVEAFLKYFRGDCEKKGYLVISLDDVDMRDGEYGLRALHILEEIFAYLSWPGIIVLMTYNEPLLSQLMRNQMQERFYSPAYRDALVGKSHNEKDLADKVAQQLLTKLIDEENRIYMPDFERINLFSEPGVSIRISAGEKEDIPEPFRKDLARKKKKLDTIPAKQYILRSIAYYTGVYYDICGTKRHFFEPRNLRELSSLIRVLDTFENIPERGTEKMKEGYRQRNRQKLLLYFYNQYAGENLLPEEANSLHSLATLPLDRQIRRLVVDIRKKREQQSPGSEYFLPSSGADEYWNYSYGELLYNLYSVSRLENAPSSKKFISTILGSYSVLLNQLYSDCSSGSDLSKKGLLEEIIGASIASSSTNRMLPPVRYKDSKVSGLGELSVFNAVTVKSGSAVVSPKEIFKLKLEDSLCKDIIAIMLNDKKPVAAAGNVKGFVQAVELLGMFFTLPGEEKLNLTIKQEVDKDGTVNCFLCSENNYGTVCFNALNFAVHSVSYEEYFKNMGGEFFQVGQQLLFDDLPEIDRNLKEIDEQENTIRNGDEIAKRLGAQPEQLNTLRRWFKEAIGPESDNLNDLKKKKSRIMAGWKKFIGEASLRGSYESWTKQGIGALPLQHFDMMYNLVKRAAGTAYYNRVLPDYIQEKQVLSAYVELYDLFYRALLEQDEQYEQNGNGFADHYIKCPYYEYISRMKNDSPDSQEEDVVLKHFRSLFGSMIHNVLDVASRNSKNLTDYR